MIPSPYNYRCAMNVTFYKTKLSSQNRCYDKDAYDAYLATCEQYTTVISDSLVPNNDFYVLTTETTWFKYNYIVYEYANNKIGAFITDMRFQAFNDTLKISQRTDIWYFVLQNIGIDNFDFHGRAARAHVNDISSANTPLLTNTYATAEERFNTFFVKKFSNISYLDKYYPDENGTHAWIYIFVANKSQTFGKKIETGLFHQTLYLPDTEMPNNGIVLAYPGVFKGGEWIFWVRSFDGYDTNYYDFRLSDLTFSSCTAITISRIPPTNTAILRFGSPTDSTAEPPNVPDFNIDDWANTQNLETMPAQFLEIPTASYYPEIYQARVELGDIISSMAPLTNIYCRDTIIDRKSTYEEYLDTAIIKARAPEYFQLVLENDVINYSVIDNDTNIYLGLSFDLSKYIISINLPELGYYNGKYKYYYVDNYGVFSPDVINDYWTRMNALQMSAGAQITENRGISQGVSAGFKVAKQAVRTATDIAGSIPFIGNVIGRSNPAGAAQSALDLTETSVNFERTMENARLTSQIGRMQQDVAESQLRSGQYTGKGLSYYTSLYINREAFFTLFSTEDSYDNIAVNLHRFGYNTYLQLDEIYHNHRRQNFNFIQAEECEVTGLPQSFADDIENMFLNGVHLWSGEVENFEVINYQEEQ